jgi:DNA-binding beta-propeller fold protein YncE
MGLRKTSLAYKSTIAVSCREPKKELEDALKAPASYAPRAPPPCKTRALCGRDFPSTSNVIAVATIWIYTYIVKYISICTIYTCYLLTIVSFIAKWSSFDPGTFIQPEGVAVDASGDHAYVVDTGNNLIKEFQFTRPCPQGLTEIVPGICYSQDVSATNAPLLALSSPRTAAVDSSHSIYVTDTGNNLILKFIPDNTTGTYTVLQFGKGVGTGNGEFKSPVGIAVDAANHVYVADSGNNRIEVFTHK